MTDELLSHIEGHLRKLVLIGYAALGGLAVWFSLDVIWNLL